MSRDDNPFQFADEVARRHVARLAPFIATVVSTSGGLVSIKRPGHSDTEGPYPAASGLAAGLVANDKVLVIPTGSIPVVVAEIVTS